MNDKTIDPAVLQALGIALSPEEEAVLVAKLQEALEERIGAEIMSFLSEAEAVELQRLAETGSPEQIREWVTVHVPDYQAIAQDEYDILMGEVAEYADELTHQK